jgi:hypothetical protein
MFAVDAAAADAAAADAAAAEEDRIPLATWSGARSVSNCAH